VAVRDKDVSAKSKNPCVAVTDRISNFAGYYCARTKSYMFEKFLLFSD
jgi:hypothetical protein